MDQHSFTGNNTPAPFTKFLWWLATADADILSGCKSEKTKYSIIGLAVMATWLFASLAWTYFFYTVSASWLTALLPGLFMGFIILTIDRVLIKGITASNKRKIFPLLFRGILAICIGSFMAQPAVMYIFNKEITQQVALDNEARKAMHKGLTEQYYSGRKQELLQEKERLIKNEFAADSAVAAARQNFIAETDGTGGSGKRGVKEIALAKKSAYVALDSQYRHLQNIQKPFLDSLDQGLAIIDTEIKSREKAFAGLENEGFLTRASALNNLLKTSPALQYRYYLIVFILVLIELLPVLAKSMLPSGSYDASLKSQETLELADLELSEEKQRRLLRHYHDLSATHDEEAISSHFNRKTTYQAENHSPENFAQQWKIFKSTFISSPRYSE
ncbi:MAG: DUF4407 domain-containing protein [Ferruginibacter sp.]